MARQITTEAVFKRLEQALGANELPIRAQKLGYRLLNRLNSPVRVALLGTNASETSCLLNALLEQTVLTDTRALPCIEIAFGPKERTSFISGETILATQDGISVDQSIPSDVNLIRFEIPNAALKNVNLLHAPLTGGLAEQEQTVAWAQNRADISLWCTHDFNELEQYLWSKASEELKDNSYMVLTNADQLYCQGLLGDRVTELNKSVAEEFFRLFAVGARTAANSINPDGSVDQKTIKASGVDSLRSAIVKRVDCGQTADTNSGLLFLKNNGLSIVEPAPEPTPALTPTPCKTHPAKSQYETIIRALGILSEGASDLSTALTYIGTNSSAEILEHCLQLSQKTADLFVDAEDEDANAEIQQDFMEVSDMLVLMQLEKDANAAADAVTLLLQLKRGMEVRFAA